ncbi:unnamed protein product [Peniophora sp. CBMAI 1063]|nr:unnamed protein product [Peniophora sp. CBMAI 1063]
MHPVASLVLFPLALSLGVAAIGTPFGMGSATTGGGSATAQTPTNKDDLVEWLQDSTPRVIILDRMWDFSSDEGTETSTGCAPWDCTPNPQQALNVINWCSSSYPTVSVTYNVSSTSPLYVGSNKSIIGKGKNSGFQGKGLYLPNVENVIIQNIVIKELNHHYVWGGDAIQLDGTTNVWIDHNYIQHIGRQMIVTGFNPSKGLTVSNNVFNGDSIYSTGCDGYHYWVALFAGDGDEITFAQNSVYMTSGRGPHIGGTSGYTQAVHIYNNNFGPITGHALDPYDGASVLAEGNYFIGVETPLIADGGAVYAPLTSSDGSACQSALGRACVANTLLGSGSLSALNTAGISSKFKGVSPMSASDSYNYVAANAGTGIIN